MKAMKAFKRALFGSIVAPLVVLAVACGGSSSNPPGTSDGGVDATSDGSNLDGSADAGGDLFPADTTKITVTQKGGFTPGPPDGSTCSLVDTTYTLSLPSRELSWKICEYGDGGPYAFATGQRILSEAEFAPVSSALHGLRRATKTACGADKPSETIVFTTPAGDTTYYDDFYFCDANDTKAYVTGLGNVLAELSKLAK